MYKHEEIFEEFKKKILQDDLVDGEMLPTEKDLCGIYGVSRITVMRAIKDLAKENFVKRIPGKGTLVCFREKRNHSPFHLIIPLLRHKYYSEMAACFNEFFQNTSAYGVVLCTYYNNSYTKTVIDSIMKSGTCGIAVVPSGAHEKAAFLSELILHIDAPAVIGSRELKGFTGYQVVVDEEQAGVDAAKHLIGLGHRRIAYIGQKEKYSSSVLRYKGFLSACSEAGLSVSECPHIAMLDHIALRDVKELFGSEKAPTAVVTPSEVHAIEAYDLLTSLGLKIPEDVALLGLDGGALAPAIEVPLTTIDFPGGEIGRCMAKALLDIYNGVKKREKILRIKAPLTIRASCGAHPEKYRHEYLRNMMENM